MTDDNSKKWRWLPDSGTPAYHALLLALGMLVLGPLGGVAAAYMVFSVGFFVGGQVLAGIIGSAVTFGYGAEGRHGANYIQTAAASVASMSGMGVIVQAMAWLGIAPPSTPALVLYMLCIAMFGAGVGMLYTPLLVERMQLPFPSGAAVANILRALTDPVLLKRSIGKLAGGAALGVAASVPGLPFIAALNLSASTLGAGLVVGSRIAVPALVSSLALTLLTPRFVEMGLLQAGEPYRKAVFLFAIGLLLGAVCVDMAGLYLASRRYARPGATQQPNQPQANWSVKRLVSWVVFWAAATAGVGAVLLDVPPLYAGVGLLLTVVFALVNGIATGISDSNPLSIAFVVGVIVLAALGLGDAKTILLAGAILFIGTSVSTDMQQDRSTGWRLGSDRRTQFRYQVAGLFVGAVAAVGFANFFMDAYPVLRLDQTTGVERADLAQWTSAATYKFVGAIKGIAASGEGQHRQILIGAVSGFCLQLARAVVLQSRRFQRLAHRSPPLEWAVSTLVLPSPYAWGFGAFINLPLALNFAAGGALATVMNRREQAPAHRQAKDDMSSASLLGGGLIVGEALTALVAGIAGLLMLGT